MTKIIKCTCDHEFQDETYGEKLRVYNETTKGWTYTVCGNVKIKRDGK